MKLPLRYKYKYTVEHRYGESWCHIWSLIGEHGGIHFHATKVDPKYASDPNKPFSCGLEAHWRKPPSHMKGQAPSKNKCWLLQQPCWHGGTTLQAEERILSYMDLKNPLELFEFLYPDADAYFKCEEEEHDDF